MPSEASSRSWQFIELDPVLAGRDRETLQAQLALAFKKSREVMPWSGVHCYADRAIGKIREEMQDAGSKGIPEVWWKPDPSRQIVRLADLKLMGDAPTSK